MTAAGLTVGAYKGSFSIRMFVKILCASETESAPEISWKTETKYQYQKRVKEGSSYIGLMP